MFTFIKGMLSDGTEPSTSRGLSWTLGICACVCIVRLVWHNNAFPDAGTMVGITAFISAPYAINRITH